MNGNEITQIEFKKFMKTASKEDISQYIVESIKYTDTPKNIHINDMDRIELLAKRDNVVFPKESIDMALEQLRNNTKRVKIQNYIRHRSIRAFLKYLHRNGR